MTAADRSSASTMLEIRRQGAAPLSQDTPVLIRYPVPSDFVSYGSFPQTHCARGKG